VVKVVEKETKPGVICHLGRADVVLKFRVEDAAAHKPTSLARIVIGNVNLVPDLGADSFAVTWSDGRAKLLACQRSAAGWIRSRWGCVHTGARSFPQLLQ
jgi:hypothetical protein